MMTSLLLLRDTQTNNVDTKSDMKQWVRGAQEAEERFCWEEGKEGREEEGEGFAEEVVGKFVGEIFGEGEGLIGFDFYLLFIHLFIFFLPLS